MLITEQLITSITNSIIKSLLKESYDSNNFFIDTYAIFKCCNTPSREPDYVSVNKKGYTQSDSAYWYTKEGVYRESNHWSEMYVGDYRYECLGDKIDCGNIASCWWVLECNENNKYNNCGFCPWEDFQKFDWELANSAFECKLKGVFVNTEEAWESKELKNIIHNLIYKKHLAGEELQREVYKIENKMFK